MAKGCASGAANPGGSRALPLTKFQIGTRPIAEENACRLLIGLAAAAGIGLASIAAPAPANAGCFGCAVGVGVLGGVAAGAIIGSAIANSPPPGYYPPPPGYYPPPPPGYYPPPPGRPWAAARPRLCAARAGLPLGAAPGLGREVSVTRCGLFRSVSKPVQS